MRIVVVDDEPANNEYVARVLSNFDTVCFDNPSEALTYCTEAPFDILITDQRMPKISGIELARRIRYVRNDFAVLVISAYTDSDDLIDAVNSNVIYKYIVKPFSPEVLLQNVHRTEEYLDLQREKERLEQLLRHENARLTIENRRLQRQSSQILDQFVGYHPSILRLKELVSIYARSDQPILLTGETGTGKELIARAIHSLSPRADRPFVPINCSALPDNLLESELFGYEKGAFTGADAKKPGLFRTADGGTIFLDEIADLPLKFQPKVLRVIQFGTFYPIGSTTEQHVDVRIVSATNRDIRSAVDNEGFRSDLFYRISGLEVKIPPLREHIDDVLPILNSIIVKNNIRLPPLTDDAKRALASHRFPGNVRELENIVEKLRLVAQSYRLESVTEELVTEAMIDGVGKKIFEKAPPNSSPRGSLIEEDGISTTTGDSAPLDIQKYVDDIEKRIIGSYLNATGGNISKTARLLSMSRQGLRNKLKRYGMSGREHDA